MRQRLQGGPAAAPDEQGRTGDLFPLELEAAIEGALQSRTPLQVTKSR